MRQAKFDQARQRRNGQRSERGVVMLVAVASLVMLIPMVGLTVDVGYLYASKTRLQAAVDGAALAAARALNLGATTASQAATAKQNAVNWFYSNFPPGNWATTSTVMNTGTVTVTEPVSQPNLRIVAVTAQTRVPTYFMKWFHINNTLISANGTANRRDVVVMMVLDRSGSMLPSSTNGNHDACVDLKAAAKLFTGQFAAGRDRIGMVSFSDGTAPPYAPSTSFRTTLGFNDGVTSGTGALDQITCLGGTGTAGAISVGYNELMKANQPGAYNILLLETDGLPNALAMNWWDSTRTDPNKAGLTNLGTSTGCTDTQSTPRPKGYTTSPNQGWGLDSRRRNWLTSSNNLGGFLGTIGPGMIGSMPSSDPGGTTMYALGNPFHTTQNMGLGQGFGQSTNSRYAQATTLGCMFAAGSNNTSNSSYTDVTDFLWAPRADIFGNDVKPANNYLSVTMVDTANAVTTVAANQKYLQLSTNATTRWTNYHNGVLNATDHAAFRARAGVGGGVAASVFVIGLGGNSTVTPDYHLMQRWANDSTCDQYNLPISTTTGCGTLYTAWTMPDTFDNQPKGKLVFSANHNSLRSAFLNLSSQILRLSQ